MAAEDKGLAWSLFDRIAADGLASGDTNPWVLDHAGRRFEPNFDVLKRLLAVPLHLKSSFQSGIPALALDVWTAFELRRAGFDPDAVWPRAEAPRVLPQSIATFVANMPAKERKVITERLAKGHTFGGSVSSSAHLLGKNYVKQVDVVMSSWETGPEIMISTKRMDSSFGKNAANRVEESYGDAKNLRSRHPQAALGFLYGLRSTALDTERDKAEWLIDLLSKLGREDDAYDAVALIIPEYGVDVLPLAPDDVNEPDNPLVDNKLEAAPEAPDEQLQIDLEHDAMAAHLDALPVVNLVQDSSVIPDDLQPGYFFAKMVDRVLDNCPITFHRPARTLRANPRTSP